MQTQLAGRGCSSTVIKQHRHRAPFCCRSRSLVTRVRASTANGNGKVHSACPNPAETARTVADLAQEGVLCTLTEASTPLGTPVGYNLDKEGNPVIVVASGSPEAANISRSSRCSLLVQPIAYPARGVASVALQGSAAAEADQSAAPEGTTLYKMEVDSCVYYGGLDQVIMPGWPRDLDARGLFLGRGGGIPCSAEAGQSAAPDKYQHTKVVNSVHAMVVLTRWVWPSAWEMQACD